MANIKSTTRKSFKVAGPLRSIGVKAGTGGVRVSLNGQDVVNVRNQAPAAGPVAGQQPTEQEASTIRLGRFIAERTQQGKEQTTNDSNDEDEREIIVGPITPIPTPIPTPTPAPIANRPIQSPRPARLGL